MTYFYNKQIKRYITQFLRIFSGMSVATATSFIDVPVRYGSSDRVVANVLYKDGTFIAKKVPMISGYLSNIDLNPEAKKSKFHQDNITIRKTGSTTPSISTRIMGVPYKATMQLSIWASNSDQMFQIIEQIMLMFNPYLTIQKSDNILDWSYLTDVELLSLNNEQNYPIGVDDNIIVWTLEFTFDMWINFPAKDQATIIQDVFVRVHDESLSLIEIDYADISSLVSLQSDVSTSTLMIASLDVL